MSSGGEPSLETRIALSRRSELSGNSAADGGDRIFRQEARLEKKFLLSSYVRPEQVPGEETRSHGCRLIVALPVSPSYPPNSFQSLDRSLPRPFSLLLSPRFPAPNPASGLVVGH